MFVSYVLAVRGAGELSPRVVLMTIAALQRARAARAAAALHRHLQLPVLRADAARSTAATPTCTGRTDSRSIRCIRTSAPSGSTHRPPTARCSRRSAIRSRRSASPRALSPTRRSPRSRAWRSSRSVWNAARLRGLDPVKAAALVGLNPLIVVYGVGGGHNDLLMLAVLMAGVLRAAAAARARQRRVPGRRRGDQADRRRCCSRSRSPGPPDRRARRRPAPRRPDRRRASPPRSSRRSASRCSAPGRCICSRTLQKSQTKGDWHSIPGLHGDRGSGSGTSATSPGSASTAILVAVRGVAAAPRVAGRARLDRRRRLGDARDAGDGQLAAALVRRLAAAAGRAQRRPPPRGRGGGDDRGGPGDASDRLPPARL